MIVEYYEIIPKEYDYCYYKAIHPLYSGIEEQKIKLKKKIDKIDKIILKYEIENFKKENTKVYTVRRKDNKYLKITVNDKDDKYEVLEYLDDDIVLDTVKVVFDGEYLVVTFMKNVSVISVDIEEE